MEINGNGLAYFTIGVLIIGFVLMVGLAALGLKLIQSKSGQSESSRTVLGWFLIALAIVIILLALFVSGLL